MLLGAGKHLADAETLGGRGALVNGEMIALDPSGRPDFAALQQRMRPALGPRQRHPPADAVPVVYMSFDLLGLKRVSGIGWTGCGQVDQLG